MRSASELTFAIETACRVIAPSWPLDRQIAVNPYWGFIERPFTQAAAILRRQIGARFALPPGEYLRAWHSGQISASALTRALAQERSGLSCEQAVAALQAARPRDPALPLLSDLVDRRAKPAAGPRWRETITQQVSQYCASYFDERQADWHRERTAGLFAGWRRGLHVDHAIEPLMNAPDIRARARRLADDPQAAIGWALDRLGVPPEEAAELLQVCLLRINGWASWCAYLGWEAGLAGATDMHLRELLAIRVSWEALLHDGCLDPGSLGSEWRQQWMHARCASPSAFDAWDRIWQRAHEISYQDQLIGLLESGGNKADTASAESPTAQLVFCIDVRSERFRRALESIDPALETRGFAGFFGMPIRYTPIGTRASRPQLPGLISPLIEVSDSSGDPQQDAAIARRRVASLGTSAALQPFLRLPSAGFSLVETLGLGYAGAILRRHFGAASGSVDAFGLSAKDACALAPTLGLVPAAEQIRGKAALLAGILRTMSLGSGFARLLVFVGHGGQSANNPQAAALDCGACGGQSGDINARLLAGLINDPAVRRALVEFGIDIPAETVAVGALHNTTTDEVTLFDLDRVPGSHAAGLARLQRRLVEAGLITRAERAPSLGLGNLAQRPDALLKVIRRRARDWAETRPEWGLADNAAFIVAPRWRTRGRDLAGRCFLHDYCWADDRDGEVLEQIMTAPMLVTHWINLQYYASTVDPDRFGSGNKVLHNVVCGRIGVFEGNTGDLRIGLSHQSVRDHERWMHTPLRLSVFIDAPRERIEDICAKQTTVRRLVANEWLYLFRFTDTGIERLHDARWQV